MRGRRGDNNRRIGTPTTNVTEANIVHGPRIRRRPEAHDDFEDAPPRLRRALRPDNPHLNRRAPRAPRAHAPQPAPVAAIAGAMIAEEDGGDPAALLPPPIPSLSACLDMAGQGTMPPIPIHEHPDMIKTMGTFIEATYGTNIFHCPLCKEISFTPLQDGYKYVNRERVNMSACSTCLPCWMNNSMIPFGSANCFDPFEGSAEAMAAYATLPKDVTEIESMLMALHSPIMKIYRLKGGSHAASGNVINFVQNIDELAVQLPRTLSTVNVLVVRRQQGLDPEVDFKDFKVRRGHILAWLTFLKAHNRHYAHIDINLDNLNGLPDNNALGVFAQLRTIEPPLAAAAIPPPVAEAQQNSPLNVPDDDLSDDDLPVADAAGMDDELHAGLNQGPQDAITGELLADNILETGVAHAAPILNERQQNEQLLERIQWPNRQILPINEYETVGLFAKTFPTLFPFGNGDPTDRAGRQLDQSINATMTHLNRYAIPNGRGGYSRPFDACSRFSHYIQDVDERQRINKQVSAHAA